MDSSADSARQCPESDVSVWVGFAGLLGLMVWLLICRNWPAVADLFGISGPRQPLSGPYAALVALLFSGIPMVLVTLLVDRAHMRPSTGIDWQQRKPISEILDISIVKLAGLWATWALIALLYGLARWYWEGRYLFAMHVLGAAVVPLLVFSVPYVLWLDRKLVNPRDGAWHFGAMLIGREAYDRAEVAHHLRAWAVKGFFCAFMISILPAGFKAVVELNIAGITSDPVKLATWLIELMFVVDVQIAMVGYLVTMKPLDAHIRTANPYLGGWLAALMCYPPFVLMDSGRPLDYQINTSDWTHWLAAHPGLLWVWGAALVFLTAIYAWATVAFGLRFSNLTYRGVLTNGPYRFTRHPAYLSKNLYWWLATLPFLVTSNSQSDALRNTAILAMVSAVYYWRAKTEERHLSAEDSKYRDYSAWMLENATITSGFARAGKWITERRTAL
jgi:protein-S-isoprenylcysteine O-methyltransferase Ste14